MDKSETIKERLRALNVFPKSIGDSMEIFQTAQTTEQMRKEMEKRKLSCSEEQFLFLHLEALIRQEPQILERAEKMLGNLGLPVEYVREFFSSGMDPTSVMNLIYENKYPYDIRERFSRAAIQFTLDEMRRYLEIREK